MPARAIAEYEESDMPDTKDGDPSEREASAADLFAALMRQRVFSADTPGAREKLIFRLIIDLADDDGVFRWSIKRLSLKTGIGAEQVEEIVQELVLLGALEEIPGTGYRVGL